jgi:hypothetical protein
MAMNKPCILLLSTLFLFACNAAIATDEFTPKEREAIDSMVARLESRCQDQMKRQSSPANEPAIARWVEGMTQSLDYCSCSTQGFRAKLTPAIWRSWSSGGQSELGTLARAAGTECIVPSFKSTFPEFCEGLRGEINKGASGKTRLAPEFCGCVQKSVDGITVENFSEFMENTVRDYQEFQRTRQRPADGPSLVPAMFSCGLDRVKPGK